MFLLNLNMFPFKFLFALLTPLRKCSICRDIYVRLTATVIQARCQTNMAERGIKREVAYN